MKYSAICRTLAGALVFAGSMAPSAHAADYHIKFNNDGLIVLPKIDRSRENIVAAILTVDGSVHYQARAYGDGINVGPYAVSDSLISVATAYLPGQIDLSAVGVATGTYPENTYGAPGTYIDYGYDVSVTDDPATRGGYILLGDDAASVFSSLYGGPAISVSFDQGAEGFLHGIFSRSEIAANLQIITAPVPEPATWAMMILGMGMVGAALRYRRKSTKVSFG